MMDEWWVVKYIHPFTLGSHSFLGCFDEFACKWIFLSFKTHFGFKKNV
jgi:hypothetical protein